MPHLFMVIEKAVRKMKNYFKTKYVWYVGLVSLLITILIVPEFPVFTTDFTIRLKSSSKGSMQIFYATKGNYTENNSIHIPVEASESFKNYTIKLTLSNIKHVRIDPPHGDFSINSVWISNRFGQYSYNGTDLYDRITHLNDISELIFENNNVEGKVNGTDPYLQIDIPVINEVSAVALPGIYFLVFIVAFILSSVLWGLYLKYDYISINKSETPATISAAPFKIIVIGIFVWFAFQLIFYAVNIAQGIAPDEVYHIELSKLQSESISIKVEDSPRTYYLGAVSVRPYLYHYLMGRLLFFNIFNIPSFIYLRLINILLSLTTLYLTLMLTREVSDDKWVQLAVLIIQTNILMNVFISAMVSYDNLVNLLSTASFLILIRFLKNFSRKNLLLLIITMVAGALTKISYGPIVVIQIIILIGYSKSIYKNRKKILKKPVSVNDGILAAAIIVLFGLNINLYANNILTYGQVQPKTSKVLGDEISLKYYAQYQRNYKLQQTLDSRVEVPLTRYLIMYCKQTAQTIFGVFGHKSLVRSNMQVLSSFFILTLLSIFLFALRFRERIKNAPLIILLFSIIAYSLVVVSVNYQSYQALKLFGLALQGRYNFPILALASIFFAYNFMSVFRKRTKTIFLIMLTAFMVYNSFFWFISHATPDWYIN